MPEPNQLVSYIIQQAQQGYDVEQIRSYLLSYGYSPEVVEESLRGAYAQMYPQQNQKSQLNIGEILHAKNFWIIAMSVIIIILVGGTFLFMSFVGQQVGRQITMPIDNNVPGEIETTPTATTTSTSTITSTPTTTPTTTSSPKPTGPTLKETCYDKILNQGETGVDCGGPCKTCEILETYDPGVGYQTDEIPGFRPGTVDPGLMNDSQKTGLELLNEIKTKAKTNPTSAAEDCPKLRDILQDDCYTYISEQSNISEYCEKVKAEPSKDACYVSFALRGQYELCNKITAEVMKQTCNSLGESSRSNMATGQAYALYAVLAAFRNSRIG